MKYACNFSFLSCFWKSPRYPTNGQRKFTLCKFWIKKLWYKTYIQHCLCLCSETKLIWEEGWIIAQRWVITVGFTLPFTNDITFSHYAWRKHHSPFIVKMTGKVSCDSDAREICSKYILLEQCISVWDVGAYVSFPLKILSSLQFFYKINGEAPTKHLQHLSFMVIFFNRDIAPPN